MPLERDYSSWKTRDEITYLRNIGNHSIRGRLNAVSRLKLLAGYIRGADLRTDWNGMDKEEIMEMALALYLTLKSAMKGKKDLAG